MSRKHTREGSTFLAALTAEESADGDDDDDDVADEDDDDDDVDVEDDGVDVDSGDEVVGGGAQNDAKLVSKMFLHDCAQASHQRQIMACKVYIDVVKRNGH